MDSLHQYLKSLEFEHLVLALTHNSKLTKDEITVKKPIVHQLNDLYNTIKPKMSQPLREIVEQFACLNMASQISESGDFTDNLLQRTRCKPLTLAKKCFCDEKQPFKHQQQKIQDDTNVWSRQTCATIDQHLAIVSQLVKTFAPGQLRLLLGPADPTNQVRRQLLLEYKTILNSKVVSNANYRKAIVEIAQQASTDIFKQHLPIIDQLVNAFAPGQFRLLLDPPDSSNQSRQQLMPIYKAILNPKVVADNNERKLIVAEAVLKSVSEYRNRAYNDVQKYCKLYKIDKYCKSILDQVASKRETLEFNGQIMLRTTVRYQAPYDNPAYLRIFVSKTKSKFGDELSTYSLQADDLVIPYSDVTRVPLELYTQASVVKQGEKLPEFLTRRRKIYRDGQTSPSTFGRYFDYAKEGVEGTFYEDNPKITGVGRLYDQVEARYFYCKAYEHYVSKNPYYLFLKKLHELGFNLILSGTYADPLSSDPLVEYMEVEHKVFFYAERVLACLLTGQKPWEQYRSLQLKDPKWRDYPDYIVNLGKPKSNDSGEGDIDLSLWEKAKVQQDPSAAVDYLVGVAIPPDLPGKVQIFRGLWKPIDCSSNPKAMFIFGDNDRQTGTKGQAEIRGKSNAYGIPTEKAPYAPYQDTGLLDNIEHISKAIKHIILNSPKYNVIYFPEGGIGTGLAKLATKAPNTWKHLNKTLRDVFSIKNGSQTIKIQPIDDEEVIVDE